jgi:hypothetical protein
MAPIAALNWLKTHNDPATDQPYAPKDFQPQRMYGFIKSPGKVDPFPVKHYDASGTAFDSAQVNENGITTTRPGVILEEVVAWWGRAGERQAAKAQAKLEKAKAKEEKAAKAAGTPAVVASDAAGTVAAEEEGEGVEGEYAEPDEAFEQVEAQ